MFRVVAAQVMTKKELHRSLQVLYSCSQSMSLSLLKGSQTLADRGPSFGGRMSWQRMCRYVVGPDCMQIRAS